MSSSSQLVPVIPQCAEEFSIEIDGVRMRYLRAGSGPPLVFLHGLMGYSFSWRFTLPAVANVATAYAIDLPGAGYSDSPSNLDCTLRATSARVIKFVNAMGLKEYDLLGTSYGGAVAQMVAAMSAESDDRRLRRLILVAPVNPYSAHGRRLAPFVGSAGGAFLFRRTVARWRNLDHLWLERLFGDTRRIPADSLAGYRAPVLERNGFDQAIRIVRSWTADLEFLRASLPRISHYPALLIWGRVDRAVLPNSAKRLQEHFPNSKLVFLDGVGHLPYEEVPEEFNRILLDFLTNPQMNS